MIKNYLTLKNTRMLSRVLLGRNYVGNKSKQHIHEDTKNPNNVFEEKKIAPLELLDMEVTKKICYMIEENHKMEKKQLQYEDSNFGIECSQLKILKNTGPIGIDAKILDWQSLELNYLKTPNELNKVPIPRLCNGLEHVAKLHSLVPRDALDKITKCDTSKFYKKLPKPKEIDNAMFGNYTPPSRDPLLLSLANKHECSYVLSTSTAVPLLIHIDFLITGFKSPLFQCLSYEYTDEPLRYIISMRKPESACATLIQEDPPIIGINSDDGLFGDSSLIFMDMGKYLESMMTHSVNDFNRKFLLKNVHERLKTDKPSREFYSFLKADKIMLRSQIDSGMIENGIFKKIEIKTRAVMPQRYDSKNYEKYLDYPIYKNIGLYESYEREYYDLIRSAFNKYLHQMTIGGMDGLLVAYHNTNEIFGFEYFNRWHLEKRIYGSQEFARICFKVNLKFLQEILDYIFKNEEIKKGETLKIGFYANNIINCLTIMTEKIEDIEKYKKKLLKGKPNGDLNHIVDYYNDAKIFPEVTKYVLMIYPNLNGVNIPKGVSIHYEPNDCLEYTYNIKKIGKVDMDEYMKFLHETYNPTEKNIENEYSGAWWVHY